MAEVLLFHHAQGLTPGVVAFADTLRGAGLSVHTPDLFAGHTFDSLENGMRFVNWGRISSETGASRNRC